ncbi:hypothetical protein L0F63_001717, partial [Massospora cicadina]
HSIHLDVKSTKSAPQGEQSQGVPGPPHMGSALFAAPATAGPSHQQDSECPCLGKLSSSPSYGVSHNSPHISNSVAVPVSPPTGAQASPSGSEGQQPCSLEESSSSLPLPPLGVAPARLAVALNPTIWFALGAFSTLFNVCFPHMICRSPLLLVVWTAMPLAFWALHWVLANPDWEPSLVLLSRIHVKTLQTWPTPPMKPHQQRSSGDFGCPNPPGCALNESAAKLEQLKSKPANLHPCQPIGSRFGPMFSPKISRPKTCQTQTSITKSS